MIKFDSNSHWYQCRGSEPTPQHDADLRVARKQLLYPSVTTIDKDEFKNDFLERWKMNELAIAAAGNQMFYNEKPEDYANRIYALSLEKARLAANFGKDLHNAIEQYPQLPLDAGLQPWVDQFGVWYEASVLHPIRREAILFDHDIGVAGRCDFIGLGKGQFEGRRILPDWKSQNIKVDEKRRKKPVFYDSWARQLAFYAVADSKESGIWPEIPVCISVIMDSNEPDAPFVKVWTDQEILSAYEDFVIAAYRWFKRKKYFPQQNGMFKVNVSVPFPK